MEDSELLEQIADNERIISQLDKRIIDLQFNANNERHALTAENAKLRAQLAEVYSWFENAPISYTNGVEHGGVDEGDVIGWQRHEEIQQRIAALLGMTL